MAMQRTYDQIKKMLTNGEALEVEKANLAGTEIMVVAVISKGPMGNLVDAFYKTIHHGQGFPAECFPVHPNWKTLREFTGKSEG